MLGHVSSHFVHERYFAAGGAGTFQQLLLFSSLTHHGLEQIITKLNAAGGGVRAAYTFDAGPNAVIYLLQKDVPVVLGLLEHYFPSSKPVAQFIRGKEWSLAPVPDTLLAGAAGMPSRESDGLNYILCTRLGPGPEVLADSASLIGPDGLPKKK